MARTNRRAAALAPLLTVGLCLGGLALASPAVATTDPNPSSPDLAGSAAVARAAVAAPAATTTVTDPLRAGTYRLSSYYGPRCIPTVGASSWHLGQDFGAADGTPIYAVAGGVVRTAGAISGFGQWIVIDHTVDGKRVSTVYGHMWNATRYVHAGQKVTAGQRIASVGANGTATGPHLHLEVWPGGYGGTSTDPLAWLTAHKVAVKAGATSVAARTVPASCTYYTNASVNLRTGASTTSASLGVYGVNTRLTSKPGAKTGDWVKVTAGGRTGWMYDSYVSPSKSSVPAVTLAKPVTRYVTATTLNVRASASTSARVVAKVSKGKAVSVLTSTSSAGWAKIRTGSVTGWVSAQYLTATKPGSTTKPAPKPTYPVRYVDVTTLNLRKTASTSATVLAKLHEGAKVQTLGATSKAGWVKVSVKVGKATKTGYVSAQYLRTKP